MKKTRKIILLVFGIIVIGSFLFLGQYFFTDTRKQGAEVIFLGRDLALHSELALTANQHRQGLMNRNKLDPGDAMLFVFSDDQLLSFWMKNTLMPLDLVFVSSGLKIVDIKKDFEPCRTSPCQTYQPTMPARYVVEMNAGLAEKKGLELGDKIEINMR